MKKILLLIVLFALPSFCQEHQEDKIAQIFNEIKQEIFDTDWESLEERNLDIFLHSHKAATFKQKMQPLSQENINRLMGEVIEMVSSQVYSWPVARDFLALAIESGGDINAHNGSNLDTFLIYAMHYSDLPAIKFALKYNADTTINFSVGHPLNIAKKYDIAELLIYPGALDTFQNNTEYAYNFLLKIIRPTRSYQLLEFYSKKGLNLKVKDMYNSTLLHRLCKYSYATTPFQFFEKFRILLKNGAVDLNARNNQGQTALDIIKENEKNKFYGAIKFYCATQLARSLLEGLQGLRRYGHSTFQ